MDSLDKEIRRLKNLKQNANKTNEELEILAKEKLNEDNVIKNLAFCVETDKGEEKEFALDLYRRYTLESSIENEADKDTLVQLIDQELLAARIKRMLKDQYSTANPTQSLDMVDQLDKVIDRIGELKEQLGLSQSKDEKNDTVKVINSILERFHKWVNRPENRSNYEFQCPKCMEIFLVRRRLDKISDEVKEHPWFIDGGILFNKAIFEDLELGKISEDQAARFLNATLDYIHWIRINYPLNQDKKEIEIEDEN